MSNKPRDSVNSKVESPNSEDVLERVLAVQLESTLPKKDLRPFSGKLTEYQVFSLSFRYLIEQKTNNEENRLQYLLQYTANEPHDLISACVHLDPKDGYKEARKLLDREYGNKYGIATAFRKEMNDFPPFNEDSDKIKEYALLLTKCGTGMKNMKGLVTLDDPELSFELMLKLPLPCQRKWRQTVQQIEEKQNKEAGFEDFSVFIRHLSSEWNHPVYGLKKKAEIDPSTSLISKDRRNLSFATNTSQSSLIRNSNRTELRSCPFCERNHPINTCGDAKRFSLQEIREVLRGRCFGCLKWGHWARAYHQRKVCDVCSRRHPTILHDSMRNEKEPQSDGQDSLQTTEVKVRGVQVLSNVKGDDLPAIAVALVHVKIRIQGLEKDIVTYAAQDPYSTDTFFKEELLKALGIEGTPTTVFLTTMGQKRLPIIARTVKGLEISDLKNENTVTLPEVLPYKDLPVDRGDIPTQDQIISLPHLAKLPIQWSAAKVGVLIGMNVPGALRPLKVVQGKDDKPYALWTKLGWTIHGPMGRNSNRRHKCNLIQIDNGNIKDMVQKLYDHDVPDPDGAAALGLSLEDRQWLKHVEGGARLVDGQYLINLPFRSSRPKFPNNRDQALQCVLCLKRNLLRDPSYFTDCKSLIEELLAKGIMEAAMNPREDPSKSKYIPPPGVYNPRKPGTLRVVFDCSAAYIGVSLNSALLQEPDLINGLLGVLFRFRQEKVALVGDIEAMFHQVKVPEGDKDFLRLLWWLDGDLDNPVPEFRLAVHLFGGVSSPSCANFALQKTARDHVARYGGETTSTVLNNFYVDDLLKSVKSVEKAQTLQKELVQLCAKGGFKLTKFISNCVEVMNLIPQDLRAPSLDARVELKIDGVVERALGVLWSVDRDCLEYFVLPEQDLSMKRKLLSTISSVCDPLGMVAPAVLPARQHF
ncbi:uncharacterized protein LOC131882509 [Tigriopus californicus]|uniref:uncharacterized protein LOC131882509 n=1 Tax=Tigriopus californicus TaxID=6832 RepID=UPI0027DA9CB7|nr:uncharacterized protein LOC131882509 [Tigriopus californicus]